MESTEHVHKELEEGADTEQRRNDWHNRTPEKEDGGHSWSITFEGKRACNTDEGVNEKTVQMITLGPGLSEDGDMEEARAWTPPGSN